MPAIETAKRLAQSCREVARAASATAAAAKLGSDRVGEFRALAAGYHALAASIRANADIADEIARRLIANADLLSAALEGR